jgi:putative transcriptional regulator
MTVMHHPSPSWLLDYAAGNASPLFEAVLRAHTAICAECRQHIAFAERLGGDLLAGIDGVAGSLSPDDICDNYEQLAGDGKPALRADESGLDGGIEKIVATYLNSSLDALPWRRIGGGLALCRLAQRDNAHMWMLRGGPGMVLPEHTHAGSELTLVLKGAYFCGSTIFRPGDIEEADETTEHQPVITRDGECICLAVTEGRLKFKRWLPRIAQPFFGI